MDPMKIQKLHAMNKYKKNRFLINSLVIYSFTALICIALCSSPLWFPSVCSSIRLFLFVSLPKIVSVILGPKCLFIISNIIVAFLVGESKLTGSCDSLPASDIYDDYVKRNQSLRRSPTTEEKKSCRFLTEETLKRVEEDGNEEEEEEYRGEDLNGEEGYSLPAEEFKRRVEDFIARVNKQRRLEAREIVCCSA
ncbi:PREDICTED: uncharacterized protein LOC104592000 [Nelumbo nucifera]|uniref:DUF4408 domain-containing protein n=2 Tax=Nelumbo nucifera TaxID=4432 RepID=A0A822Y8W4_NELNU|nr:PREDICTED: uncharacterized protein LOC104592000 [Nelumbo nucifera]DAD30504.1 TPA_asm: hypothetical protein HUJ06_009355 [Nelumbo nucifera]